MSDRSIKPYFQILTLIFAAAFLAGTLAPTSVRNEATNAFQFVVDNYRGLEGWKLFFAILLQNVTASFLILFSGVLIGIVPIFAMGSNGFILGVMYRHAAEVSGYSNAALKVLPHGVIEIPALLIGPRTGCGSA